MCAHVKFDFHSHSELTPITHQSNGNDTKRLNLAMLPILCTLEPKFLKIGVTLLA